MRGRAAPVAAGLVLALGARPAAGGEGTAAERPLELRVTLASTLLVERNPDDPVLFPERSAATSLWRLRLEGRARLDPAALEVAYEQRLLAGDATAGAGLLPPERAPPWRLRALDAALAQGRSVAWRHELDRALAVVDLPAVRLSAGRQAVGWGRGVLFGAIDLFAPFGPLEVDRDWRRGVDALRLEAKLAPRLSAEALAVGGERLDACALAGRVRGYAGQADLELVAAWRARDLVAGAAASAAVGEAEVHAELAAFRTVDDLPVGDLGERRLALKAVIGSSYRVPVGQGVLVLAEYHHSGFGVASARDLPGRLASPGFAARLARGDSQITGREALALTASYEASPELTASFTALASPADGSGVLAPGARLDLGDRLSVLGTLYLPFGAGPRGGVPQSEYGATPLVGLLQLRIYG